MTHRDISLGLWNRNWDKEVDRLEVVDSKDYSQFYGLALVGYDKSGDCWSAHPFPYDVILVLLEVEL